MAELLPLTAMRAMTIAMNLSDDGLVYQCRGILVIVSDARRVCICCFANRIIDHLHNLPSHLYRTITAQLRKRRNSCLQQTPYSAITENATVSEPLSRLLCNLREIPQHHPPYRAELVRTLATQGNLAAFSKAEQE